MTIFLQNSQANYLSTCLCQIDIQVLQSLPHDIRSSIEAALQTKHCGGESINDETSVRVDKTDRRPVTDVCCVADDDEQPGCSHWTNNDARLSEYALSKCTTSLPSYSQVI